MVEEHISQELRLKNIDETRNYFLSKTLIYIKHFLILDSAITGCISVSAFASLLGIPVGLTSFAIGLKIYAITAGIKYKSIIKKKKKRNDKIVLLAKAKLNTIEVLIDSNISYDEFALINNMLKEYDDMKEEIKNLKT